MRKTLSLVATVSAVALASLAGCSNPLAAIVGSTTVICSVVSDAGASSCLIERNFPSAEQSSLVNSCTNNGGSIVDSCPTNGLLGCCTQTTSGFVTESCYYAGTVSQLKSQCGTGTWSTSQ